jgi:hypothetical protein
MGSNENETKVSVEGIKSDEVGISQREDELEIIEQPESAEVKLRCLNQLARKIYVMRVLNDFKKCQKNLFVHFSCEHFDCETSRYYKKDSSKKRPLKSLLPNYFDDMYPHFFCSKFKDV